MIRAFLPSVPGRARNADPLINTEPDVRETKVYLQYRTDYCTVENNITTHWGLGSGGYCAVLYFFLLAYRIRPKVLLTAVVTDRTHNGTVSHSYMSYV